MRYVNLLRISRGYKNEVHRTNVRSIKWVYMKWTECDSIESLKELGSFRDVKLRINDDLKGIVVIRAKGWESLLKKILLLSDLFLSPKESSSACGSFTSETEKYLFCLLCLDGKNRQRNLGVSGLHYKNKDVARKWRKSILNKLHTDVCKDPRAQKAREELESMYKEMP